MTKYIVKEEDHYLEFDRFTRDMEIITICEPVASILVATEFSSVSLAERALKEVERGGKNISECVVKEYEAEEKELKEKKEAEEKAQIQSMWKNTSEAKRKEILGKIFDRDGEKGVKEWLEAVGDTSMSVDSVTKYDEIAEIESRLGITLTEEQKQQLANQK